MRNEFRIAEIKSLTDIRQSSQSDTADKRGSAVTISEPEVRRRGRPGSGQTDSIQSLVKALAILECLANSTEPVGVTEVANQIGVPKATAHRLLATLHANDAVTYNPEMQRYSLGSSIIRYGLMGVQRLSLHRVGRAHIEKLHRLSGETAVLAVRQGDVKLFVDQVESEEEIRHKARLGQLLPLYHGGAGHAMLSFFKPDELDEYLSHGPFPRVTPATITDPDQLRLELQTVRQRRYAITRTERITSIGSAILDHRADVIGAVAVFAPTFRVPANRATEIATMVRDSAAQLSTEMGYSQFFQPAV
jgi:IclR family acetate operon transcriptional repressor